MTLLIHPFIPTFSSFSPHAFHPCCVAYFFLHIYYLISLLSCLVYKSFFSGPFSYSHSHSQALDCCSTLMAFLFGERCQSLRRKRHLRSWSTLRDNLWCRLFLSQMQGTASDKQKQTSSLISWEYLWVVKLQKLVVQLMWCPLTPLLLTSPNISSISRSHKIKSSCLIVHWGCLRSFMTSVCWCRDRDQSWKLLKSILESCFCSIFCHVCNPFDFWTCVMLLTASYHSVFSVGFQNVVSIDMLRESFPLLDMVDHNRRPKLPVRYWRKWFKKYQTS